MKAKLSRHITYALLTLFALSCIAILTFIVLNGLHIISVSDEILTVLIKATVTQAATMLIVIIRYLFK